MLGVDPAANGAAVLLDQGGRRVLAAWAWTERTRAGCRVSEVVSVQIRDEQYRVTGRRAVAPLGSVGELVREEARDVLGGAAYALAGENAVVGRAMDTSIVVARNAGRVLGPLEALAVGQRAEWVRATEWRHLVLGLHHRTARDAAKAEARRIMPLRIPSVRDVARLLGDTEDLYDAAGVAAWLAITQSNPACSPSPARRPKPATSPQKPAPYSRPG